MDEYFIYQASRHRRLPIRWMAPETLTQRLFSQASDVWSFGVLAWKLFSYGEIPYGSIDGNDIVDYINAGNRSKLPNNVPEDLRKILSKCWEQKRENRPSFGEIKKDFEEYLDKANIKYGYIEFKKANDKNHFRE